MDKSRKKSICVGVKWRAGRMIYLFGDVIAGRLDVS